MESDDSVGDQTKPVKNVFIAATANDFSSESEDSLDVIVVPDPEDPPKVKLWKQGLYSPGSGEICAKYIACSASSVLRHPYYDYPSILDPGIETALLYREPIKKYADDGQQLYLDLCKAMNIVPIRIFHRGLLEEEIDLKYYGVNPVGIRAMSMALSRNQYVQRLDLTSNFLDHLDASYHLGAMLGDKNALTELVLSGCNIGPKFLRRVLHRLGTRTMDVLDLSGNKIKDEGFPTLTQKIMLGAVIKRLNLRRNDLSSDSLVLLAETFEFHDHTTHLDISWNQFYKSQGAIQLIRTLRHSKVLVELNMSFCNLCVGVEIGALLRIETLEVLDLSNNSYWTRKKIPLLVDVLNDIEDVEVASSSPLELYTLKTWVSYIDTNNIISVSLDSVHRAKDCYELNLLRHTIMQELMKKYADWVVIYTDGSMSKKGRGAAFFVRSQENSSACFKINENVCIMSLELIAISEALSYIKTIAENRAVICSDSKSALYHIARCASGRRGTPIAYEILSKIEELAEKGVDLRLQWVPSHIGIRGNEEADRMAKIGSTEGQEIYVKPYYSEILTKYNRQCNDLWKEYFDQRSLEKGLWYKTIQCQPPRIPWCTYSRLSRKLIITAHRIRTGHIPSNKFAFLMGKVPSPNCDTCGVIDDVYHLLMECIQFHDERKELFEKFGLDILQVGIMNSLLSKPNSEEACLLFNLLAC